jgi:hypothetical protein
MPEHHERKEPRSKQEPSPQKQEPLPHVTHGPVVGTAQVGKQKVPRPEKVSGRSPPDDIDE